MKEILKMTIYQNLHNYLFNVCEERNIKSTQKTTKQVLQYIIKSHHEKNTLTWENRGIIIQDIIEDREKVNGSQIPEMKYMDTVLIHFLLYHKRDDLSDLIGIDKKKITLEWKE